MLGKRSFSDVEGQGGGQAGGRGQSAFPVTVKLLCPTERSGPVIGKGGDVIRSIRMDTGAKIKVEDTLPGQAERAIIVSGPDRPGETCATQDALQRLLARVVEIEGPDGMASVPETAGVVVVVDRAFARMIIGRGGTSLRQIHDDSGAAVDTDNTPTPLAGPHEQQFRVSGAYVSVKRALHLMVDKIRASLAAGTTPQGAGGPAPHPPPTHSHGGHGGPPGPGGAGAIMGPLAGMATYAHRPPHPGGPGPGQYAAPPAFAPAPPQPPMIAPPEPAVVVETVYRLLVPDGRVGGLIGKGGDNLKRIRQQTGAEVQVEPRAGPDAPDRLVACRSAEPPDAPVCGAAEALMRVVAHVAFDKDPSAIKAMHVLVPGQQLSSVIGVQGAMLRQLSADTGARALLSNTKPPTGVGLPTEEVLVVEGTPQQVQAAMRVMSMLLRGAAVRAQLEARGLPATGPQAQAPPAPTPAMAMPPPGVGPAPSPMGPGYYGHGAPAPQPPIGTGMGIGPQAPGPRPPMGPPLHRQQSVGQPMGGAGTGTVAAMKAAASAGAAAPQHWQQAMPSGPVAAAQMPGYSGAVAQQQPQPPPPQQHPQQAASYDYVGASSAWAPPGQMDGAAYGHIPQNYGAAPAPTAGAATDAAAWAQAYGTAPAAAPLQQASYPSGPGTAYTAGYGGGAYGTGQQAATSPYAQPSSAGMYDASAYSQPAPQQPTAYDPAAAYAQAQPSAYGYPVYSGAPQAQPAAAYGTGVYGGGQQQVYGQR